MQMCFIPPFITYLDFYKKETRKGIYTIPLLAFESTDE